MDLWDAVRERNSIRVFKPDPLPRDLIEKILRAGLEAPSSANMQPWEFVVVAGKEKDRLGQLLIRKYSESGKDYNFEGTKKKFPARLLARREKLFRELFHQLENEGKEPRSFLQGETFRFYGAPIVILVFMDRHIEKRFFFDLGLCVQNVVLAAQAEGLGSHLIGLILKFQNTIKEALNIPPDKRLTVGICIGYADPEAPINRYRPERDNLDQMVNWVGF